MYVIMLIFVENYDTSHHFLTLVNQAHEMDIASICLWNDTAMGWLYDNYYRALVGYGCQFVEQEIAEDAVQEIFAVLWQQRPVFKSRQQLVSYLYTGVHNLAYNHLRHKSVLDSYRQHITSHLEEFLLTNEPHDAFNKEEIYRQLLAAVDMLPPRQREIFLMCMEGKKNKEIATQLEISAETVKVQKRRAINALKEKLSPASLLLAYMILE